MGITQPRVGALVAVRQDRLPWGAVATVIPTLKVLHRPLDRNRVDPHNAFWLNEAHEVWRTDSSAVASHVRRASDRGGGRAIVVVAVGPEGASL